MLISYILPCYNTESYIDECINSLYAQDLDESEFEVICVNNASLDNLEKNIQEARRKHSNIVNIKLDKNIYTGGAYNEGIEKSRGKYIIFVDSDDYLKPHSVKPMINIMEQEELEALQINIQPFGFPQDSCFKSTNIWGNGNPVKEYHGISGIDYLSRFVEDNEVKLLPVPAYRRFFLRDFIVNNNLRFTKTSMGCDMLFTYQILSVLKRLGVSNNNLYMFRFNPTGITKSVMTKEKVYFDISNLLSVHSVISKMPLKDSVKQLYLANVENTIDVDSFRIKLLSLSDKIAILNDLDLDEVRRVSKIKRLAYENPSLFLKLFRYTNDRIAGFAVRVIEKLLNLRK